MALACQGIHLTYLFQQQLPIYPHRRLPILPTILPQPPRHFPHPLQTIPAIQQILNILRHDFRHISQLVVQFVQILRSPTILVRLLRPLYERVELDEGIRSQGRRKVLCGGICGCEFGGEVREVGEGEFARVGFVADAEEADRVLDRVAVRKNCQMKPFHVWLAFAMTSRTVMCRHRSLYWLAVPSSCSGVGRSFWLVI